MIALNESIDYPNTIKNLTREVEKNRDTLDALKEDFDGITLKEAFTSDELSGYIPQIFTDEVILLGLRDATARNLFTTVGQATNDSFTQRYKSKSTRGVQILRELNEIKTSKHELSKETFGFNKLASAALFSWERLMDSPLQDALDESTFSVSQFYRTENQLMWDNLCRFSQGDNADTWENHIDGPNVCDGSAGNDSSTDAESIFSAMEEAYLSMTTALTDRFEPSQLRWLWSPEVEAILWKYATFREYQLSGKTPIQLTGSILNPFGIPRTIIEPGYFGAASPTGSAYTSAPCDIYLVAPSMAAGIRERVSQRLDNFTRELVQASGTIIWERICCWTRHPLAFRRISPERDYAGQIADNADIVLKVKEE